AEIEPPRIPRTDLRLHHAGRARKNRIGSRGADDDEPDLGGSDACFFQRGLDGVHGEIGRGHARLRNVPLADAGALQDPLVAGLDHLLEIGIREHPRGNERSKAGDLFRTKTAITHKSMFIAECSMAERLTRDACRARRAAARSTRRPLPWPRGRAASGRGTRSGSRTARRYARARPPPRYSP